LSNSQLSITKQPSPNENRRQDNEKEPSADNIYEMMADFRVIVFKVFQVFDIYFGHCTLVIGYQV
jgi:hypothetical protein